MTQTLVWAAADDEREYDLEVDGSPKGRGSFRFSSLRVEGETSGGGRLLWEPPGLRDLQHVQWIDAVRCRVLRRMPFGPRPFGPLHEDGRDAPLALAWAQEEKSPVFAEVVRFYREQLQHVLTVQGVGDDCSVNISPAAQARLSIPLTDTGEGLSQVLPIAVALARAAHADGPRLLSLEQPELHLHPRLHEALADWVIRLVSAKGGPRVMLETHSENVLLAVLLALVEGRLLPDQLVVYWVTQREDGQSVADRCIFDEMARPTGAWPPDIFQEDAALASRLNLGRLERLRR